MAHAGDRHCWPRCCILWTNFRPREVAQHRRVRSGLSAEERAALDSLMSDDDSKKSLALARQPRVPTRHVVGADAARLDVGRSDSDTGDFPRRSASSALRRRSKTVVARPVSLRPSDRSNARIAKLSRPP